MNINKSDSYFKFSSFGLSNLANKSLAKVRKDVFTKFKDESKFLETDSILDVGVSAQYHPTSNFFEQYYPYKNNLTALGLGDFKELEALYPGITYVQGNGSELPFESSSFDWIFSHAVIEHVGNNKNRISFIKELLRVSKKGVILTTPNRLHPLEFHTGLPLIHYFPKYIHRFVYNILGKKFYAKEENLNLFTPKEIRNIVSKTIVEENLDGLVRIKLAYTYWLGLPSNIIVVLNKTN